jgi:hypothetical protein
MSKEFPIPGPAWFRRDTADGRHFPRLFLFFPCLDHVGGGGMHGVVGGGEALCVYPESRARAFSLPAIFSPLAIGPSSASTINNPHTASIRINALSILHQQKVIPVCVCSTSYLSHLRHGHNKFLALRPSILLAVPHEAWGEGKE